MRIAIDAMGGDHAPREIVAGTLQAAGEYEHITRFVLVGDKQAIQRELDKAKSVPSTVEIHHASEVVKMNETPVDAIRKKRDSSIVRSIELIKDGEADAVFSSGNTGAMVAASTLKLRLLSGVDRPAIATVIPTPDRPFVLLDAGATPDCTPRMIAQFAVMGAVYARKILGRENPLVGLLSIGEEDAKGNDVTRDAFRILEKCDLEFAGNVESKDMFEGRIDVVACDGFVGNIVLKTSESVAKVMARFLKESFTKSLIRKLGATMLIPAFKEIKSTSDPAFYGGAPLLGVNGICIIGHGSSSAFAVKNGIRVAAEEFKTRINHLISEGVEEISLHGNNAEK